MNTARGKNESQLYNIKKKKRAALGFWSLLREIALSYDVSLVFPGDSHTHWLIESQNLYLPGFIPVSYLIDFPVYLLYK